MGGRHAGGRAARNTAGPSPLTPAPPPDHAHPMHLRPDSPAPPQNSWLCRGPGGHICLLNPESSPKRPRASPTSQGQGLRCKNPSTPLSGPTPTCRVTLANAVQSSGPCPPSSRGDVARADRSSRGHGPCEGLSFPKSLPVPGDTLFQGPLVPWNELPEVMMEGATPSTGPSLRPPWGPRSWTPPGQTSVPAWWEPLWVTGGMGG